MQARELVLARKLREERDIGMNEAGEILVSEAMFNTLRPNGPPVGRHRPYHLARMANDDICLMVKYRALGRLKGSALFCPTWIAKQLNLRVGETATVSHWQGEVRTLKVACILGPFTKKEEKNLARAFARIGILNSNTSITLPPNNIGLKQVKILNCNPRRGYFDAEKSALKVIEVDSDLED
ncbi:uncharacterized protein LOC132202297 [Neocloeon triangulifer]|uniref:uncharacterized protein LOC132202297 n=1 Tax=Neocloeon triangulifer TaxID=2078957 RepID=UPI00286EE2EC|nr:uncharacterized protein LOC132202297 [Neocloeon triangulifer]